MLSISQQSLGRWGMVGRPVNCRVGYQHQGAKQNKLIPVVTRPMMKNSADQTNPGGQCRLPEELVSRTASTPYTLSAGFRFHSTVGNRSLRHERTSEFALVWSRANNRRTIRTFDWDCNGRVAPLELLMRHQMPRGAAFRFDLPFFLLSRGKLHDSQTLRLYAY